MTEYDFSPEAYQRYLATQNRIAKWVDDAERHRSEFQHAVPNGSRQSRDNSRDSSPEPPRRHSSRRSSSRRRPRPNLHINPPPFDSDSDGSEAYGPGPGPMPVSAPGLMYAGHPSAQQYPNRMPLSAVPHPMLSPPPLMLPPTYITSPHRSSSQRRHHGHSSRRSHSHHRSPSYIPSPQPSQMYYASPPVSPGMQYAYPSMSSAGAHHGFVMVPPPPLSHYGSHYSRPPVVYMRR